MATTKRSNNPAYRRRTDTQLTQAIALDIPPIGAVTVTEIIKRNPYPGSNSQPRYVEGSTMPRKMLFPRVREWASNLTPNPAEKMEHTFHPGTVGRFSGNFGNRSTPSLKTNLWKPTGLTGPGDQATIV